MNSWARFEQVWGQTVLSAMIPSAGAAGLDVVSLQWFWDDFDKSAPTLFKLGLRAAVWFVTFAALLSTGTLFHRASETQRDQVLQRLSQGAYLSRQLIVTIKVVATLAYFGDPKTRVRFPGAL